MNKETTRYHSQFVYSNVSGCETRYCVPAFSINNGGENNRVLIKQSMIESFRIDEYQKLGGDPIDVLEGSHCFKVE